MAHALHAAALRTELNAEVFAMRGRETERRAM
jgi:hypothetical protein